MSDSTDAIPTTVPDAVLVPAEPKTGWSRLFWALPLVALIASVAFAWTAMQDRGPVVVLHAGDGYGIGPGDAVRYLGIDVGIVEDVRLGTGRGDEAEVRIEVRMRKDASDLARAGTRFWVVRPELTLDSVEGLETIIGSRYVALFPGPDGAEPRTEFTALPEAPLAAELAGDRGLEIVLEAKTRYGIQPGAGVVYRGVRIGTVISVGLASDATSVEVRAVIRSAYSQLVRQRSVFWETGGFEFELSFTGGLEIDLDSVRSALVGGIAMATPVDAGDVVSTGSRFPLRADAKEEWLSWAPALPLGSDLLPPGAVVPTLLRGALSWSEGRILRSRKTRIAWFIPTPEGLIAPADVLTIPQDARQGEATLEVAGRSFNVAALVASGHVTIEEGTRVALVHSDAFENDEWLELSSGWTMAAGTDVVRRTLLEPEDFVLLRQSGRDPIGVDAARVTIEADGATIDPRIAVGPDWHGAVAIAREDGAILGLALASESGDPASIVPLP